MTRQMCLFFWLLSGYWLSYCTAVEDLGELHSHQDETVLHCVHDSSPRFGKQICNCGYQNYVYVAPKFDGSTTDIEIANCKTLHIRQNTFEDLFQLTTLSILNIDLLTLDAESFNFTRNRASVQLKILLQNVLVEDLPGHLVNGFINEITFKRCSIGIIRSFSISTIRNQLGSLNIIESFVSRIERQAFKKFDVNKLTIEGSRFAEPIPSQSFYDVEVIDRFTITNSSFNSVLSSAFSMKKVSTMILSNSEFESIAGESFIMHIKNTIRITGNYFNNVDGAAFMGVRLDDTYYNRHSERPALLFNNNRFKQLEGAKSLHFSDDFIVHLKQFYVSESINCDQAHFLKQSSILVNYPSEVFFVPHGNGHGFKSFDQIQNIQCATDNFWLQLIIGVTVTAILLTLIALLIAWYCVTQKKKQKRQLEIVRPEPRTYRETQIVMQLENHGLLKTDL